MNAGSGAIGRSPSLILREKQALKFANGAPSKSAMSMPLFFRKGAMRGRDSRVFKTAPQRRDTPRLHSGRNSIRPAAVWYKKRSMRSFFIVFSVSG